DCVFEADRKLKLVTENQQQYVVPVSVPPTLPTECSVTVSANNSSTVAMPTLCKNNIFGSVIINANTSGTSCSDDAVLQKHLQSHKATIKKKIECIFEGKKDVKNKIHLKKVYTQVFITEGELKEVNNEHEILKIDKAFNMKKSQDTPINCNQIFNLPWKNEKNKLVLTKGVAGIGKTVSVQKFILDWAEGDANQDIDCMFLLPFREINLVKDGEYSFHELLLEFYPELDKLKETKIYEDYKLAFIFDGLDESRLPLDFNSKIVCSVTKKASVDALITNLVKGNILPSTQIWITSRPAAAHHIPSEHVSLFTEVRGFTDAQKEEYFKKRIMDENKASKIIYHIKTSRSLYIMCHIPVFCWITATVLQAMLVENHGEDIPTTLTEMYIHFLLIQMNIKNQKYDMKYERDMKKLMESNREMILKLAKLAFEQLKKKNIMFYENDLRESGIDVTEDSEFSGICTEIFKQESVLHEEKVYCFIHLSVQEFLAALHVFCCYLNKNFDELQFFFDDYPPRPASVKLDLLLKKAVDRAKQNERGHLDLFLRFLLGISLESSQKFLNGLLPHTEKTKKSIDKVIQHIRQMQNKTVPVLSPETSINNFFCLLELKERSHYNQIKKYLNMEAFPERELSSSNCSALAYMLLMSEEVLDEFDPKKYNTSSAACRRLVPVVRCCRKALFAGCELTESCCEVVSVALQADNSPLRELDLSDNYSIGGGVKQLSDGLKSSHCKLEILRLSGCSITEEGCSSLASALTSNPSHLKELDLTYNHPGESGVKLLSARLQDQQCKLLLKTDPKGEKFIKAGLKKYARVLTFDPNTAHQNLYLSDANRKVTNMNKNQQHPYHPDRFEMFSHVLCKDSQSDRCYWEVDFKDADCIIGVTYEEIQRKEFEISLCDPKAQFDSNPVSWCLRCISTGYEVCHDSVYIKIHAPDSKSSRIGVYLDWPAGKLSFYSISSDTQILNHIHTFQAAFQKPLYPAFTVHTGSVSLCQMN
ncbi:hypothetical protein P4O66_021660, partial [Electrophorus voltai]